MTKKIFDGEEKAGGDEFKAEFKDNKLVFGQLFGVNELTKGGGQGDAVPNFDEVPQDQAEEAKGAAPAGPDMSKLLSKKQGPQG